MKIDTIYEGRGFVTLDPQHPIARRVGVHQGRFVAFDDELDGIGANRRVDVGDGIVYPGFIDAHYHLSMHGDRLRTVDLRADRVRSMAELLAVIKEAASTSTGWVRAAGYDQNILGRHPTAEELDAVSAGRPVWIEHVSSHMGVANTEAFRRAGFADRIDVPDVDGGIVVRGSDGHASGLLQEKAQALVTSCFLPLGVEEVAANIGAGATAAAAVGLTSVTEPGIGDPAALGSSPLDLLAFQVARDRGLLAVRTTVMPYMSLLTARGALEGRDSWIGLDLGMRSGFGDERLRLGAVKISTDGSLIGRSAFMSCCYEGADDRGILQYEPSEVMEFVLGAHSAGWDVAAHAIGDAAVDLVLDAVEQAQRLAPRPDARHRIEHFGVSSLEQVRRAASLGIIPVPQGRFITEFGDGMASALGADRALGCYRMRSLLEAGMTVPGSSDAPIADGAPLAGIHDMVNRRTAEGKVLNPAEALTPRQAITAYTLGSAFASRAESWSGSITAGKVADMVVLSDDLERVAPARIAAVQVGATIVGDDIVHDAGAVVAVY